jgi:hypothetical protein
LGVLLASSLLAASTSHAQGSVTLPNGQINVQGFGAHDDAQVSTELSADPMCGSTISMTPFTCSGTIFTTNDVGKTITISEGASHLSMSFSNIIVAVSGCTGGLCNTATLASGAAATVSDATFAWGTDNGPPFQAAANACPPNTNVSLITPFTSRG